MSLEATDEHLVSLLHPTSWEAGQYLKLGHLLEQKRRAEALTVVAVSSPGVGDGKTTTTINLAAALAHAHDARVLLVDADLHQASLAACLGLKNRRGPGLADVLSDPRLTLDDVVTVQPPLNLGVLPAGSPTAAPYDLLRSPRLGVLLTDARRTYDYVVLDTPPLLAVPDFQLIATWADGFLLVVACHKTPRKLLEEALNTLDPAKTLGLVFNSDDRPLHPYYYYHYYGADRPDKRGRHRWWSRIMRKPGAKWLL